MPVDEYFVTFRTRGQYPAAPPTKVPDELCRAFLLLIFRADNSGLNKEKQPPARSGCFTCGVFLICCLFLVPV